MHESEQRGKLLLNGKPMPNDVLSRILGLDKQRLRQTLDNLLSSGVASIDDETDALTNRRMVKDEYIRQVRKEAGQKGGNPNLLNQKSNQNASKPLTKNQPLHSSSSISSSKEKEVTNVTSQKKGSRLPDDFVLTDEMKDWAEKNTPSISAQSEFDKFCDYWRGKAGKDGVKLDWTATLRNWFRNAVSYQTNGVNSNGKTSNNNKPLTKREQAIVGYSDYRARLEREAFGSETGSDLQIDVVRDYPA